MFSAKTAVHPRKKDEQENNDFFEPGFCTNLRSDTPFPAQGAGREHCQGSQGQRPSSFLLDKE
tara:strand:+ start:458 stop:646 length:189 start_codon:yes stop_codon:yes gene_type:complete